MPSTSIGIEKDTGMGRWNMTGSAPSVDDRLNRADHVPGPADDEPDDLFYNPYKQYE
jgi:hypothetical protein